MSSDSPTSSIEFALRRPDPGQRAMDARVMAMSPDERVEWAYRMRQKAFVLVNHAADNAGPMSELDRAIFILRRLYPEFDEQQLDAMRRELGRRERAGQWTGFVRPSEAQSATRERDMPYRRST